MKNQIKKSLSFFMAVLMVLSCWVWVAPDADAVNTPEEGYYYVQVRGALGDSSAYYCPDSEVEYNRWKITTGNGTYTLTSNSVASSVENYVHAEGWVYGLPSGITHEFKVKDNGKTGTDKAYNDDGWRVSNVSVWVGPDSSNMAQISDSTGDKGAYDAQDGSFSNGDFTTFRSDIAPKFGGFRSATASTITEEINKINGADVSIGVPTFTYSNYFDQYGVKYTGALALGNLTAGVPYISKTAGGPALTGAVASDIYYDEDTGKIVLKANLQQSSPENNTFYFIQKYTGEYASGGVINCIASAEIVVTYPDYTVSVNGAGSVSGLTPALGGSSTPTWTKTDKYGAELGSKPDGTASATGYTFKGLWTEPQPTSGKASYNEFEADFAEPISKTTFDDYVKDGGVADGKYITYKEKLYYNAGTKWDPNATSITGDASYYGWWISTDISVKFYDIDGKFLGTKSVKYGQDEEDMAWPTPTQSYVSGPYTYSNFSKTWVDTNGDIVSQSSYIFTKDLILTPKYTEVKFDKKYVVSFINEDGDTLTGSAEYNYRQDIKDIYVVKNSRPIPSAFNNDNQYSYTFEGWSAQDPSSGYYHVLLEDRDFNEAGTAIAINTDWIVRDDVTYYPVYRRHLKAYVVEFTFKDSTGNDVSRTVSIKYGETLSAPTAYVLGNYAANGHGFEFVNWTYSKSGTTKTFAYDGSVVFNETNFALGTGALDDGENVTPIAVTAIYKDLGGMEYNVVFNSKNDKGEDQSASDGVNHDKFIEADIVNSLAPAKEYDDGEAMVSFMGTWKLISGAGKLNGAEVKEGSTIATEDLVNFSPISHVTFEAVYGNPQYFYTVTYVDGANTYSERVLQGENVPAWTNKVTNDNGTPDDTSDDFEEDVTYLPKKENTAMGSYAFLGWYDEAQADETFAVTNGTQYDTTSTVTGDLTLYPQFKFTPYTYTIKFMSFDGKIQLAAGEYEYGQNIEMLIAEANRAAQAREQDDTYTYTFLGWDKIVPTFCEGKDMVFIAQYKPVYKYYVAKWYNSVAEETVDGVVTKWKADKATIVEDEDLVETGLLAATKHTYNSKLNSPSVKAECKVDAPAGQSYVFAGWYYNDAEGNAHPYVRGMAITEEMEFYATYKLSAKNYTVTTVVKDVTETYTVADGEKADAISNPASGFVDAEKHDEFVKWVTKDADDNETVFDIANTAITGDITIYAKFTESDHDFTNEELVTAPTYYEKGEKKVWCSCDAVLTEKEEAIDKLTDTVKPTGTIYLGTQGSWSSTGTPANVTDNDPVSLFANADTDIIITVNDTGDVDDLYNPSGEGKGIANIRIFAFPGNTALTADNYGAAQTIAVDVFNDDTETLNNTANYVIKLGDAYVADLDEAGNPQYDENGSLKYKKLEDGETYIVYYYVTDKAGNRLDRLVRTAKFIYDNDAPEFTVAGNSNADKITSGAPTYCDKATVTGVEVGATLTVNGEAVTLTSTSAAGTGSYTITEAGNYLVTVTDKAGNSTSKKFKVSDDHSYSIKEVLSTCTEDGYKTEVCIVCGYEKDKVVYTAPGHVLKPVVHSATCTENGYVLTECTACDYSVKTEFEVDENGDFVLDENGEKIPLYPALGHDYDMNGGEIVYTVITKATCKTKGKEIATCKACGETITREIAIDEDAHNWGATKTLKATCTESGKTYHTCKLCYTTEDLTTIPATGHVETQWVETTAATCGEAGVETLQCKKCKAYVDSDDEDTAIDTREIPATGRHILAVSDDPTKTYEPTADKEGQITRYCTQCGQEWTEKVDKIEKYTVKFVDENGETVLKTITDVVSGTTIEKNAVTEPTKANSADGKYKYTFAGWKDASGKTVTLPIDVTADITLKASYTQSTIIYTHQFMVPNTWVMPLDAQEGYDVFATMMGAMGDSRVPVSDPVFKLADAEADKELKKLYTFKFLGWSTTGAEGDIVTDFTIAKAEGDYDANKTFYAVFEAEAISYQVIYYNGTQYVWDTTVDGGESVNFGGTVPTKNPDAEYHYAFGNWYTDATLKTAYNGEAITALTRLYAGFTATAHSYDKSEGKGEVTQEANCVLPELTTYTCECGHKLTEQTKDALGHDLGEYEYDEETGMNVAKCSRCDYEKSIPASVTIKFVNENEVALAIYSKIKIDSTVTYDFEKYGTPEKPATESETYEFAGWKDADGKEYPGKFAFVAGEVDAVYTAYYTSTPRTFRVTYVDVNNNTLQTQDGISYGGEVPAFTGTNPTKAKDDTNHYTFTGWSVEAGSTVTADIVIKPVFAAEKHTYDDGVETGGSCTEPSGMKYTCTVCGNFYVDGGSPATGHDYELIKRVEPVYGINGTGTDGYEIYECKNCDESYTETISGEMLEIVVNVKDANGNPIKGARVDLYDKKTNIPTGAFEITGDSGVVKFYVVPGEYKVLITANGMKDTSYDVTVKENGDTQTGDAVMQPTAPIGCTCSCHRNNFWGTIFRLFQKLIKLFTGRAACCSDPDSRI